MKAILSPELLQVLQDASNKDKVRRVLTVSSENRVERMPIVRANFERMPRRRRTITIS